MIVVLLSTVKRDILHPVTVKLRVLELMKARGIASAYQLVQAVGALPQKSKPSEATIYRLVRDGGDIESVRADTLEALAAVFGCKIGDLFAKPKD